MSPLVLHPAAAPVPSPARHWLSGVQAGRQAWRGCPASQPAARPACLPASLRTPHITFLPCLVHSLLPRELLLIISPPAADNLFIVVLAD